MANPFIIQKTDVLDDGLPGVAPASRLFALPPQLPNGNPPASLQVRAVAYDASNNSVSGTFNATLWVRQAGGAWTSVETFTAISFGQAANLPFGHFFAGGSQAYLQVTNIVAATSTHVTLNLDFLEQAPEQRTATGIPIRAVTTVDGTPLPVSPSGGIDRNVTGTLAAAAQRVSINTQGCGSCVVQLTGAWAGVVKFQGSVDGGVTWQAVNAKKVGGDLSAVTQTAANGAWSIDCAGIPLVSAYMNNLDGGGPVNVVLNASSADSTQIDENVAREAGGNLATVALNTNPLSTRTAFGNITAAGAAGPTTAVAIAADGAKGVVAYFSGVYAGLTVVAEGTVDGANWVTLALIPLLTASSLLTSVALTNNSSAAYIIPNTGMNQVRVRATAYTSGTLAVTIGATDHVPHFTPVGNMPYGQYQATPNTLSDQQWAQLTLSLSGALRTTLADLIAGENASIQRMQTVTPWNYTRLNALATTTLKSGSGLFAGFIVWVPGTTANTLVAYDNTAGSGTQISGTLDTTVLTKGQFVGVPGGAIQFNTGLTFVIATGVAVDLTAVWI